MYYWKDHDIVPVGDGYKHFNLVICKFPKFFDGCRVFLVKPVQEQRQFGYLGCVVNKGPEGPRQLRAFLERVKPRLPVSL